MTEPLYCRKCGGKYHQYTLRGISTTCIEVAECCTWCGTHFYEARPTYKAHLKRKDLDKKCVKKKNVKLKKLMGDISV